MPADILMHEGLPFDLRATLSRLSLSQVSLARLTGQSPVTVNRWMSGSRPVPTWLPGWLEMYERLNPPA